MKVLYNPTINQSVFRSYSTNKTINNYNFYTTTSIFRDDLDWNGLMCLMSSKYNNTPKVNVICHACSDGEEVYSLAMAIKNFYGKEADKFYPIIGKDIDKTNILLAKRANYNITKAELQRLEMYGGLDLYRYFHIYEDEYGFDKFAYPRNSLKENVYFHQADILNDITNIPGENTVLLCRNFWPYLPAESQVILAKALSEQLKSSSLLILGGYDIKHGIGDLLKNNGFIQATVKNVFQKV